MANGKIKKPLPRNSPEGRHRALSGKKGDQAPTIRRWRSAAKKWRLEEGGKRLAKKGPRKGYGREGSPDGDERHQQSRLFSKGGEDDASLELRIGRIAMGA